MGKNCKKNNVTEYEKHIEVDLPSAMIVQSSGDNLDICIALLSPIFKVIPNQDPYVVFAGEALSPVKEGFSIKYMFCLGRKDFDAFLNEIDPKKVERQIKKKSKLDSLFK